MDPASITAVAAIITSAFTLGLQLVQQYKLIKFKSNCCEMEMKSDLSSSSTSTSTETFNERDIKIEESPDSALGEEEEEEHDDNIDSK
jgi:hypothetical protein